MAARRPWSLVRRLTGGVALVALLAFVSQALVLGFWLRPLQDELVAGIAAHALSLQSALQAVPAEQRPALARRLSSQRVGVADGETTRQQLLAGVSHDLRTPLARLRLRAETQCEPPVSDALLADLLSLERIVDQFLAFVQGGGGLTVGRLAPLALTAAAVVRRYADTGAPVQAQLADLAQMAPDLPLQRLLGNLVDNALAYGQGPVRVELAAHEGGAVLRVLDQGLGMSEVEFLLAQQPFVRLSAARSALGHCGLGLAIVAQIARQGGGVLRLARVPGAFGIEVTLPRSPA